MRNVLIVNTIGLNYEGITSVILNYVSNMNRKELGLDFIAFDNMNPELKQTFSQYGNVCILPNRKKATAAYFKALVKLLRKKRYDVIHIHGNSGTMALEAVLSRLFRVRKVIVHCHNTRCNHVILNEILKLPMIKAASCLMACSKEAGNWLYGRRRFIVLNNAVDTERFSFFRNTRESIRSKLGISSEDFVIGHSGHFTEQKNQEFLIEVLDRFEKDQVDVKLLLLSDGPLIDKVRSRVSELKLDDKVIFVGRVNDPESYYQAMDMFAFPSKWEGLGLVLVEAQASGLPCIASTAVPQEANVTKTVHYADLILNTWIDIISDIMQKDNDRGVFSKENISKIRRSGFDIKTEAKKLEMIYRKRK